MGALTGALLGASAVSGIAGSILGSSDERRRQRAIRGAYNRYQSQQQNTFNNLAQETFAKAQEVDQARINFHEALLGQARQQAAQEKQAETLGAVMATVAQNQTQQPEGRTGTQRSAQQAQGKETDAQQMLLNAVIGSQAATQGRQGFDLGQLGQLLGIQLPAQAQANDAATLAQDTDMQNRLALQNRLNELNARQPDQLSQALNLTSGVTGGAAMMSSLFGGPPAQRSGTLPTSPSGVTGPWAPGAFGPVANMFG